MKKLIILATLVFSVISSKAQLQKEGTLSITPTGQFGYVSMSGFDHGDGGFGGGINGELRYQLTKELGISAGLGISSMESSVNDDIYHSFTYVTFPALAHYYLTKNLAAQAGLELGILAEANRYYEHTHGGKDHLKNDLEGVSLFLPIGLTWTFSRPFVAGLQVRIPVTTMEKRGNNSQKLIWFMTTFGYRFDI